MRVGSLFSGYGGLDMAVGGELAWWSDIEPAACTVMEAHHPGVANLGDVSVVDWSRVEPVDVLTGGYPCQPFSTAGQRKGSDDERHLWPFVRDAIRTLRPKLTVLENVRGHLSLGFADVLADLAELGLSARWGIVRASDAGAPHNRARLFIVAYTSECEWNEIVWNGCGAETGAAQGLQASVRGSGSVTADTKSKQQRESAEFVVVGSESGYGVDAGSIRMALAASEPTAYSHGITYESDGRGNSSGAKFKPEENWFTGCDIESGSGVDVSENQVATAFGPYKYAVRRWEQILGRTAPSPIVNVNGRDKLSSLFVEWMMGLPEGWVTGHGLSHSKELKMLGNGVVPQQARLALELL